MRRTFNKHSVIGNYDFFQQVKIPPVDNVFQFTNENMYTTRKESDEKIFLSRYWIVFLDELIVHDVDNLRVTHQRISKFGGIRDEFKDVGAKYMMFISKSSKFDWTDLDFYLTTLNDYSDKQELEREIAKIKEAYPNMPKMKIFNTRNLFLREGKKVEALQYSDSSNEVFEPMLHAISLISDEDKALYRIPNPASCTRLEIEDSLLMVKMSSENMLEYSTIEYMDGRIRVYRFKDQIGTHLTDVKKIIHDGVFSEFKDGKIINGLTIVGKNAMLDGYTVLGTSKIGNLIRNVSEFRHIPIIKQHLQKINMSSDPVFYNHNGSESDSVFDHFEPSWV